MSTISRFFSNLPAILQKSAFFWAAVIFLTAAVVRWIPTSYGYPYIHYWDEPTYLKLILEIQKTGNFDHHWYNIPPCFLYQHVAVQTLRFWNQAKREKARDVQALDISGAGNRDYRDPSILRWSRKYTAILGALICLLTYRFALLFFSQEIAVASGFILAFMPGHIEHSLFVTPDIPMAFWAFLTIYVSAKYQSQENPFYSFCMGILAGLTAATKYNGGLVVIAPCLALLLNPKSDIRHWVVLFFGVSAGFTLGFPYWLIQFPLFVNGVAQEISHYNFQFIRVGITHHWGLTFLLYLWNSGMGWPLFLLFLAGCFTIKPGTWNKLHGVGWIFPLVYALFLLNQKANIVRNLMPLAPWLAIGAGVGLVSVWRFMRRKFDPVLRSYTPVLFGLFLFGLMIYPPLRWVWALNQTKETRVQMVDWILAKTAPETVIGVPDDLRFLESEIQRIQRPTILLSQSDVQTQTRLGIDVLICGLKPGNMRCLGLVKGNGTLPPDAIEPRKRAAAIQEFAESLPPLQTILPVPLYPPRSTLDSFHEGYWLLDEWSVNPALIAAKIHPNPQLVFEPIREASFTIDRWEFMKPNLNRSIRNNPLRINGVSYPSGLGVHANVVLRFPIPAAAKRFLVDVGASDDLDSKDAVSIQAKLVAVNRATYVSPILRRKSAAWRFDIPVEGLTELLLSVQDAGDGNRCDNAVLGYCGFVYNNAKDPAAQ